MLDNNSTILTSPSNECLCTAKVEISPETTKGFGFFLAQIEAYVQNLPTYFNCYFPQNHCDTPLSHLLCLREVVYHPIPTSNHNNRRAYENRHVLYVILFLHQTTTVRMVFAVLILLYIILFLHQTTTYFHDQPYFAWLYIILFLHQTTTEHEREKAQSRCISSYSYIKPQLFPFLHGLESVVYHPIPTSNHNSRPVPSSRYLVVYHPIPTSNHNRRGRKV